MKTQEKGKGNRAFQDKNYAVAVKHFSVCITLDPEYVRVPLIDWRKHAAVPTVAMLSNATG